MKLRHSHVRIAAEGGWLDARLAHCAEVKALLILLEHGPLPTETPTPFIARGLQDAGFATVQLDLLLPTEAERAQDASFHIPLLAHRLLAAHNWLSHQPDLETLPVGLLAHNNGVAVAIRAAWQAPEAFAAIVALAGRPDLAGATPLRELAVPTLLIAGETDPHLSSVQHAHKRMRPTHPHRLLPATDSHLSDLPTREAFCQMAVEWFDEHCSRHFEQASDELRAMCISWESMRRWRW